MPAPAAAENTMVKNEAAPASTGTAPELKTVDREVNMLEGWKHSTPHKEVNPIEPVKNLPDTDQPQPNPALVAELAPKIERELATERKKLSDEERSQLSKLKSVVQKGLDEAILAALALREIREGELWAETHDSFSAFCRDEFDLSEQRVSQLLKSAEEITYLQDKQVADELMPINERGFRALRRVKKPNKTEVLRLASELSNGARPNSATIEQARLQIEGAKPTKEKPEGVTTVPDAINAEDAIAAAGVVKTFIEMCDLNDLKIGEISKLRKVLDEITEDAKKLEL